MPRPHRVIASAAAGLCAVLAISAGAAQPAAAISENRGDKFLVVYSNNIENMAPCNGHKFTNLIAFMKAQQYRPDVFTVQQVSDSGQLSELVNLLNDPKNGVGGHYAPLIANVDPGPMGYAPGCARDHKNQQTNAIIYNTTRLTPDSAVTKWYSDAPDPDDTTEKPLHKCRDIKVGGAGVKDRSQNMALRFKDTTGKKVIVASIHWPTGTWDGPVCADENRSEVEQQIAGLETTGVSLRIFAGDANATKGGSDGWWAHAIGHGYRDPMDEACGTPCTGTAYATHFDDDGDGHRIDYLLAKSSHGFTNVNTISFAEAQRAAGNSSDYSDHRALTAYVNF